MAIARIHCLLLSCLVAVNAMAQDEQSHATKRLPGDNVAWFSPDDPSVELQLQAMASDQSVAETSVVLIDVMGNAREFTADMNGKVTFNNVTPGVYGIAARKETLHGALVVAFRSLGDSADDKLDIFGLDFTASDQVKPVSLMMMSVRSEVLRTVTKNNLSPGDASSSKWLNRDLAIKQPTDESFEFRIQLGEDGSLRGKLISMMDPRSRQSGLQGTNVIIFKDGTPVGKTVANALGQFRILGVKPGIHGMLVVGRGGYSAFAFDASDEDGLLARNGNGRMFAISQLSNDGETMPVGLIPPVMNSQVIDFVNAPISVETNTVGAPSSRIAGVERRIKAAEAVQAEAEPETKSEPAAKSEPQHVVNHMTPLGKGVAAKDAAKSAPSTTKQFVSEPVNPLRAGIKSGRTPFNPLRGVLMQ